jgi:hypothetical protein
MCSFQGPRSHTTIITASLFHTPYYSTSLFDHEVSIKLDDEKAWDELTVEEDPTPCISTTCSLPIIQKHNAS